MAHLKSQKATNFSGSCRTGPAWLKPAAGLMVLVSLFCGNVSGQGDLLITPRRIVFEGPKRSMDLNLANTGQDTAVYAISLIQIRMKDDGGFETIAEPDPGQRFADRYLRFFPRTVVLGPNEAQTVKIQLTRTNELTEGEYRSHFYFRSVPRIKPLDGEEKPEDTTAISVRLIPVFGITIPAIIRVGESTAKVTLTGLSLGAGGDGKPMLEMVINRTGNMSVYGDITIDHISADGKTVRVGMANGVAVYTPNATRRFGISLMDVPGVDYGAGKLRVTYSASSDVKPAKFAEAEFLLK
ncbi:MAG TPA: hypothetical protein PLS58_11995 [Bacteroidales bacterium]|jgi:P pilus assembly chaperone PapD|nr:hypothetical protein [Bacteroidales bacterium]